jgi:hypothetical protein
MYMTALKDKVHSLYINIMTVWKKNLFVIDNSLSVVGSRFSNSLQTTHLSKFTSKYSLSAQFVGSEYVKISPEKPYVHEMMWTDAKHINMFTNTILKPLCVTIVTWRVWQRSQIRKCSLATVYNTAPLQYFGLEER